MWESALTVTVIATLAMVSPGPDFVLVVKNAARHSRQAAMPGNVICSTLAQNHRRNV